MFTQMSCFYSFHLVHDLLAVKIPYLFWQCWRLLGHALQCTPWPSMLSPLKLQLGLFFLHHSIALWMVREGSSCRGGEEQLSQWAIFFHTTWARLSFLRFKYLIQGRWEWYSISVEKFLWTSVLPQFSVWPYTLCSYQSQALSFFLAIISTLI